MPKPNLQNKKKWEKKKKKNIKVINIYKQSTEIMHTQKNTYRKCKLLETMYNKKKMVILEIFGGNCTKNFSTLVLDKIVKVLIT
jgi:ubiquinone/menaquinone biosynthesis C-methylase UbiE